MSKTNIIQIPQLAIYVSASAIGALKGHKPEPDLKEEYRLIQIIEQKENSFSDFAVEFHYADGEVVLFKKREKSMPLDAGNTKKMYEAFLFNNESLRGYVFHTPPNYWKLLEDESNHNLSLQKKLLIADLTASVYQEYNMPEESIEKGIFRWTGLIAKLTGECFPKEFREQDKLKINLLQAEDNRIEIYRLNPNKTNVYKVEYVSHKQILDINKNI